MSQRTFRRNVMALIGIVGLAMSMSIYPTNAVASDPTITLEVVWKADTETHPISNGGSIAVDGLGNLFVLDYGSDGHTYQVVKFDQDGKFVTSWGKTGNGEGEFNWRPAKPEDGPDGGFVGADKEGNVYVSDGVNFRVEKFDGNGKFLMQWGSQGEGDGQFVPPGMGPVMASPDGNVYVADFAHVQAFDTNGKFLSKFGTAGAGEGEFTGAAQVAWDKQGNIYVADLLNARYQKFDSNEKFLLQWGKSGEGDGEFNMPLYVAVDSQDHVFVTDNTNRLQAFTTDGKFIAKWIDVGNGDGPFEYASSVVIDDEDNLYVSFFAQADGYTMYKLRQK
jgi:tripartite motif-containing protein 71